MKKLFSFAFLFFLVAISASAKGLETRYRYAALIFAYSQTNSVYEDENIKLEIYDEKLWATNKTNKTIFIDYSQCFLVHNGSSFPMFEKKQNEKLASKKGVTTSIDEFLTIAPATGSKQNETFICNLSNGIYGNYTTSESPSGDFSDYDRRFLELIGDLVEERISLGTATRHLTEDESINNIGASIAYAFNKRAENWESVNISTWVSDVILAPFYIEMPQDLKKKDKRGFGVKETKPAIIHVKANTPFEFDEDKSPLVIADWVGNFKKGTFNLNKTYISKKKNVGLALMQGSAALIREDVYKRVVRFDGANADWGKMVPVLKINQTSQKSK